MAEARRICLQWPRFGPYHLGRFRATRSLLASDGFDVHGLETATSDALYGSMFDSPRRDQHVTTVFPGRVLEELGVREIRRGIQRTLAQLDPDAVAINSYSFPDALAALDWCRGHRRVAILMAESTATDAERAVWRERLKRAIVRGFDSALVGGSPQRRYAIALGIPADRVFTGYDAVDNEWFAAQVDKIRAEKPDSPPCFLASGRFVVRKNYGVLLEAYRLYRDRVPEAWPLVMLGDGPERATLQEFVRDSGLAGVHMPGLVPHAELARYYADAGCFVHTATVEQWGLVVNEAMASGLPVLVSQSSGCAEDLVSPGVNGFTFDAGDARALSDLLLRISSGAGDRESMGRQSRRIIGDWGLTTFARQMLRAWEAGTGRANRPYPLETRLVLTALRVAARNVHSFHAIRE